MSKSATPAETAKICDQLKQVAVSTLSTCLFKRGFRTRVVRGILPVSPDARRFAGPAYTLRFIPAREDLDTMEAYADEDHLHRRAIEECPEGHVLMMDCREDTSGASAGDLMVARLKSRRCAGVVTDGGFRDSDDIAALAFPAYHVRPAPLSSPARHHPVELNGPIACGGVAVYPGDLVVGDGEGVIVIPAHLAGEVAAEAVEMTAYETFAGEKISEGRSIFGLYPATDVSRKEFKDWKKQ